MRGYFNKILFLIICFFVGILSVSAKEINFYFYPNGGTTSTDGFYISDNGYIRYKDTSYAKYTGKITNINSINGKKFTVKKNGTSLVKGREWYFKNVYDNKIYYFSESKVYELDAIFSALGENGKFISLDLYANWENSKVTNGTDMKAVNIKAKSVKINASTKNVEIGKYIELDTTFSPQGSKEEKITWTSSNKKIATVDSNGKVKGIKAGKVTIIAKSKNGLKSSITIKVVKETVHKVIIKYNLNGGTLSSKHGKNISTKNDYITLNNSDIIQTIEYNKSLGKNGLSNYNNSNYINITKGTTKAISGAEWNTKSDGTRKSYSQTKVYKASDFCNALNSDCTVVLYVNWKKDVSTEAKPKSATTTPVTINVSSFNVGLYHCGGGLTCPKKPSENTIATKIGNLLKKKNIDIVGIQEGKEYKYTKKVISKSGLKYSYHKEPKNVNVILSKYNLSGKKSIELHREDTKEEKRVIIKSIVKINNQNISIYDVHITTRESNKATQWTELASAVNSDPNPVILMGDFNSNTAAYYEAVLKPIGFEIAANTTIDAIFFNSKGHITLKSNEIVKTTDKSNKLSDHNMLIATLEIK